MFFQKGGRHYWFAKYLKRHGYEPIIFSCNAKHGIKENWFEGDELWKEYTESEIQTPFVVVKARLYQGNGRDRIMNMIDFYRNVKRAAKEYAKEHGAPDIILASSVHPLSLCAGIQLAKHFKVKCISEIRDLWPESIVSYSSRFDKNNPVIKALYSGERMIYEKSDAVIFTFEGGYDYISGKKWEKTIPSSKVYYINNGIDLEAFEYNCAHFQIEDEDLNNKDNINIVYTGSIRRVNNLDLLLDAAKQVKDERVRFLIWGDGDQAERLKKRVVEEEIGNVVFKGKVEKKYVPYIVREATLCFAHNEATEMDYLYGISYNKIFDYLAAKKPVICDFPSKYNPVIQEKAGIEINCQSPETISEAISELANMDRKEYQTYCDNAFSAAKKYDYAVLTSKLIEIIENM